MTARSLTFAVVCAALLAHSQTADKAAPAPKLSGFPFQDEALRYSVNWPSGLALGDVSLTARRAGPGWDFGAAIEAGVPGFALVDQLRSAATAALCSTEFERNLNHAGRKTREKTTFDSHLTAHRVTLFPEGGGTTTFTTPACPRDALAFLYYARQELGQGRVAQPEDVYFGGAYSVRLQYTGEMTIPCGGKAAITDHVLASLKGPKSNFEVEMFFARDPARTPLLIKVPLTVGTLSVELVR